MDKYFEESYDPRLDVAPLSAPNVPKTGLINEAEYDGWDAMLELIRQRQRDKEEKKILERMGISTSSSSSSKDKKKKASSLNANLAVGLSSAAAASRWGDETASIMDIEYTRRGAVREWDLGKEGF
ncbi:hypothetical protein EST38_g7279 [Candolleomyces aberdarensis]|uniref:Uncharacterized protein n=1 Tax=Candolleomyces aberdarensis TaxID=2316362 RepID=A0A4Q2DFN5_9AGAR|nr:hypothetical protein EST38_g7279 [Candolleomyces aberdarensis]